MIYITKNNRTNHKSNLVLNEKYFMLDQSSSKYKQKKKVQFNSQNGKKKKKKKKNAMVGVYVGVICGDALALLIFIIKWLLGVIKLLSASFISKKLQKLKQTNAQVFHNFLFIQDIFILILSLKINTSFKATTMEASVICKASNHDDNLTVFIDGIKRVLIIIFGLGAFLLVAFVHGYQLQIAQTKYNFLINKKLFSYKLGPTMPKDSRAFPGQTN